LSGEDKQQTRRYFARSPKEAVMRSLLAVAALAVGMLVFATLPAPADEKADQKATGELGERIQDLNLTDQQEAKIADIRKEFRPRVQEAAKELSGLLKEEVEKARAVLTPEQKTKLEAAREERKEQRAEGLAQRITHLEEMDLTEGEMTKIADIRMEFRPKIEQAMKQLHGLLNDDQKKARQEALQAGKKRREVLQALNLTDDQREKVQAVCKEVCTLVREEMEKVRDVLSTEQRATLQDVKEERRERVRDRMTHRIANLKDLNLTEEQKTQLTDIRKEFRPKVHEAGNKLRGIAREEVEAIVAIIKE
jgi:Spy/CpxP family protein refolding chaperone